MSSGYERLHNDNQQSLEPPEHGEGLLTLFGYKKSAFKSCFGLFINVVLLGIPWLLSEWSCTIKAGLWYSKTNLKQATVILVIDANKNSFFVPVKEETIINREGKLENFRFFIHQHLRYVWYSNKNEFESLLESFPAKTLEKILESKPQSPEYSTELLKLFGPNEIVVEVKSYWRLFVDEILSPFYVFQIFSIILWSCDDYEIYASCVLFLLLLSAFSSLYQTRKQSVALHNMTRMEQTNVDVLEIPEKDVKVVRKKDSRDLVPGDILIIPRTGCKMTCDAVVLTGNVMVNESTLTGESVPVTKTAPHPDEELFNIQKHKRHVIFAGTEIVQARYYGKDFVLALVVQTGFNTEKGGLVNSILNPSPIGLKFYEDSIRFVKGLGLLATLGVAYCIYIFISREAPADVVIKRALDIFTILVPPALPAAMTVGMSYSQNRLKKQGIFCISPQRINVCGKVKLACFDKTGTLTDEGLDLISVVSYENNSVGYENSYATNLGERSIFLKGLTTCHSLTTINGRLIGDPMDLAMFESTSWILEEAGTSENTRYDVLGPTIVRPRDNFASGDSGLPYELGIIKQFVFSSNQQCMSVVVRDLNVPNMIVFTKGAPEKIASICKKTSIPNNFYDKLKIYTTQGYRLLALAYKNLPDSIKWKDVQVAKREMVECDLEFLGFIVMKNALKVETTPIIKELTDANIRTVMITGDNIMTAISVARDCKMIEAYQKVLVIKSRRHGSTLTSNESQNVPPLPPPTLYVEGVGETIKLDEIDLQNKDYHFAIEGKTWDDLKEHYSDVLTRILMHSTVFARFQPDQKTQLVKMFQTLDYIVSMVGDGANDCGALKAAHVGISLSQAEASVAAPFTSAKSNISCIYELIREGRCALVTSFATFKYMMLYSLIQFFSVIILYLNYTTLGDWQFLFIDLIITTVLAITIGYQGPAKKLVSKRPSGSLISPKNVMPMFLQILVCGGVQFGAIYFLKEQSWFKPVKPHVDDEEILCWENTVIFLVSSYQYIVMACIYSKGAPHRRSILTNYCLLIVALILISFVTYLVIRPSDKLAEILEIIAFNPKEKYKNFRTMLLIFPLAHLIATSLIEMALADSEWFPKLVHFIGRKKSPKNKYKRIFNEDLIRNLLHDKEEIVVRSESAAVTVVA